MRVWIHPTVFYILFTQCFVVLAVNSADTTGQKVSAITNFLSNEGNSSGKLNKTGSFNSSFATESNQKGAVTPSTVKLSPTSNNMTALAPGITVATSTKLVKPSVPDSSQPPKTGITIFQTTTPHASSHYVPESSTSAPFVSTATESQINATHQVSTPTATTALKLTQTGSTETNRQPTSAGVTQPNTGSLYSIITTRTSGTVMHLRKQEIILTICLSTILGVVILTIIMYNVIKCKQRRAQYTHRPLYATSNEEPGRRYNIPDDTLVISGGLYDESRVYNPNMSVLGEDDEFHGDYPAFASKYSQFRLEFLPEEREITDQGSSFNTFQPQI
ncbi:sialomucin core protein 24-like [Hemiscyllium ocellatum]|uniref:sialomucin core protein 24-like n=1 Tax=Hemiscyllium ocellatum TaxID=170820 RepID=UPI002965F3C0|nr:sialomucin core protein 24-like [Hemiscyllium ocellatum]XP_060701180.1 sialomucin core protein 24-like [Hemiscyllium ocellatum]